VPVEPSPGTGMSESLGQLPRWRTELAGVSELGFTERAALLQDRPRPPQQQPDTDAGSGCHPVPVWAHALLESVLAAERLVTHFQARAAADLPSWLAATQDCGNTWPPRSRWP